MAGHALTKEQCYYHPAPLTRTSGKHRNRITRARIVSPDSEVQDGRRSTDHNPLYPHNRRQVEEPVIQNVYLGSISFLPVLRGNQLGLLERPSLPPPVDLSRWRGDRAYMASRLIRLLSGLDFYIELVTSYYALGEFTVVPARLIIDPLRYTKIYLESTGWLEQSRHEDLYYKITKNTTTSLPTTATTPEEFYSLYSGENLRWEFVGLIFSLAAFGMECYPARDPVLCLDNGEQLSMEAFTAEMAVASNACLQLSKQYDNVNDLMIWLQCSNTGLAADVFGETSIKPEYTKANPTYHI